MNSKEKIKNLETELEECRKVLSEINDVYGSCWYFKNEIPEPEFNNEKFVEKMEKIIFDDDKFYKALVGEKEYNEIIKQEENN